MNFDKIVQWKNEIDICNMLLRSQPDNDNIKARLLLATDEYERHHNPNGYKKRNSVFLNKPPKVHKVKTPKVHIAKEPKPYIISHEALKRYKDGVLVEHYKLVRSYTRNTNKHHKVYINVL